MAGELRGPTPEEMGTKSEGGKTRKPEETKTAENTVERQQSNPEQDAKKMVGTYWSDRLQENQRMMNDPTVRVLGGDFDIARCEAYLKQVQEGKYFDPVTVEGAYDGVPRQMNERSPYDFFKNIADNTARYLEMVKDNPVLVEKGKKQGEQARKMVEVMDKARPAAIAKEYKVGDVIDFAGKKSRIKGFTSSEPGKGFFMVETLSPEDEQKHKQREQIVMGKIKAQIEANPNATLVDMEQAKKYWGRLYDEAGSGQRMEAQVNEIYAQRYEELAKAATERMQDMEKQLNKVQTDMEKQALFAKIAEERDFIIEMTREALQRRSNKNVEN